MRKRCRKCGAFVYCRAEAAWTFIGGAGWLLGSLAIIFYIS
jgi:hypothetical protein